LSNFEELEGQEAVLSGRIIGTRKFGKIAFFVIKDDGGELQLFFKHGELKDNEPEANNIGFEELNLLDPGDFVEAKGEIITTQTGEKSLSVKELRLLSKSLRPLPTKQEGFTNKEERMRRRYVDLNANTEVFERYLRRSEFWRATRDFLLGEGFVEIATPVLENIPGGADAKPFITHMDALGQDFYLRISHELPLKAIT
jgi:lysyl-tRNA synthetase, class II